MSPPDSSAVEVASVRSATTIEDEIGRLEQALFDLEFSGASSVNLTHCANASREGSLVRELGKRARKLGFVTAHLSLEELSFDTLDELVARLLDALVPPGEKRPKGILTLLDRYFERHGKRSAERFEEEAEEHGATGDLTALCRAYLAAEDDAHREVRAFEAWAAGVELKRKRGVPGVRSALNPSGAQRALSELTRIVRVLGYKGTVVFLHDGDSITARTPRQREKSYTVLRELVDNFDTGRGAVATRIMLTGGDRLFDGPRSLRSLAPLLARLDVPSEAEPPPPHRSWTSLVREPYEYVHRRVQKPNDGKAAAVRSLIRISQGLPPTEAVTSMSVGHEKIDRTIDKLFEHAEMAGSVFQVLVGDYGSGKTHILMHLAERALQQKHPVFWLNLERMNLDLGNPQRHLARLLDNSVIPKRHRPSALERASVWTRSPSKLKALLSALEEIAQESSEEAVAAARALAIAQSAEDPGLALESFLSARDLARKGSGKSYRQDAYRRLHLWLELLRRLDGCGGPVVLIDEAENLYTTGLSRAARRSALRTLAFYCGGALPSACVVLAMTPPALTELRGEASGLLKELTDVASTLSAEDAALFRRRLKRLEPEEVPPFSRPMRIELAERVRATHRSVRGPIELEDWDATVRSVVKNPGPPRAIIRRLVDQLEATWWAGG